MSNTIENGQPILSAMYKQKPYKVLFDTGADINIISDRIVSGPVSKERDSVKLANVDNTAELLGRCVCELKIKQETYKVNCWVMRGMEADFIMGVPFLTNENVIIDFTRKCMYMGNRERQTLYWAVGKTTPVENVVLPIFIRHAPSRVTYVNQRFFKSVPERTGAASH